MRMQECSKIPRQLTIVSYQNAHNKLATAIRDGNISIIDQALAKIDLFNERLLSRCTKVSDRTFKSLYCVSSKETRD